ncbi:kinase [Thraustotheca clavata]|uniref:Kinase n=1 Tax=Thraustotheca clavata TaxID=74557 RepID=A0A1V9YTH8_9STRA|nr:kinase [Thraustotheca clavata]
MLDLLCLAASLGQADTVTLLLLSGESPDQINSEGRAPLAYAAMRGDIIIAELLLAENANINVQDKDGQTPLHLAAIHNKSPILQLLLSAHADKNIKNKTGDTPLIVAIKNGHRDVAALLHPPISIVRVAVPTIKVSCDNLLGQGSYGIVVKSDLDGVSVAIKASKPSCKHSILNEISTMSKFTSPYIMPLLSIMNETSDQPQMALPYMDQGNVRQYLDRRRSQKELTSSFSTMEIAWVVANGLLDLHQQNIIHRDVKCENIFLCSNNYIKLGDLGIAREYDVETMTQAVGTLSWIAPEVFDSGHYNVSADIYSFGVVLTELETLQLPYWDCPLKGFGLIDAIRAGKARPSLSSNTEPWLCDLTTKCLDSNPENRPTAKNIVAILHEKLNQLK